MPRSRPSVVFFFNDTATTEIYTLSLHDALPISHHDGRQERASRARRRAVPEEEARAQGDRETALRGGRERSEEHTSELQSQSNLVCRLLLEKKKTPISNAVLPACSRVTD